MTTENITDKTGSFEHAASDSQTPTESAVGTEKTTGENGQEGPYAVRPHHHFRRMDYSDRQNIRVRNRLNIAFILLAVVGLVLWYTLDDRTPATIVLLVGVVLKIAEVCIRLFRK